MSSINDFPKTVRTWATGYRELADEAYGKMWDIDYRKGIFNIGTTKNMEDRDVELLGLGDYEVWGDNQPTPVDNINEGFESKYRQIRYAKKVPFGQLARDFIQWDQKRTTFLTTELGRMAARNEQEKPFEIFKNGFSTSYVNGYGDLKPTFSVNHPRSPQDSTVWSNADSTAKIPSYDGLMNLVDILDRTPDHNGDRMHLGEQGYIWIVTSMTNYLAAQVVLGTELKPGTGNNDINPLAGEVRGLPGRKIDLVYIPFLYDADKPNAHFLVAKGQTKLNVLYTTKFMTDTFSDDDTDILFTRGRMMYSQGVQSPRGVAASTGLTTTYTD